MNEKIKRLTAKRKYEVYLATRAKDANIGEVLRRYGLHLNDLRHIEATVEQASIHALKGHRNGWGTEPTRKEYSALVRELAAKEEALSDIVAEYTLLKKSERLGWKGPSRQFTSMVNGDRK